jgi:ribonuclease-3
MLLSFLKNWTNKLLSAFRASTLTVEQKALLKQLKTNLNITPNDVGLYQIALRHKSIAPAPAENNERLELLGDAVLSLVFTDFLYNWYPEQDEGILTEMRAKMESREQLNHVAEYLGVSAMLQVGKAVEQPSAVPSKNLSGNALEALVGAIYLDKGYGIAQQFVYKRVLTVLDVKELEEMEINYKCRLLEWVQQNGNEQDLQIKLADKGQQGPRDVFKVAVWWEGQLVGQAEDFSKKKAEQTAARQACSALNIE